MSDSFVTPWTVAYQAPLSMGFPRQEYWSGLPFPSLGNFPCPVIKLVPLVLAGRFFTIEPLGKPQIVLWDAKSLLFRTVPASNQTCIYSLFVGFLHGPYIFQNPQIRL